MCSENAYLVAPDKDSALEERKAVCVRLSLPSSPALREAADSAWGSLAKRMQ